MKVDPWYRRAWSAWSRMFATPTQRRAEDSRRRAVGGKAQYTFSEELDRVRPLASTARNLADLFDSYEEADDGYPETMLELFKAQIQVDAHLRGLLLHRRSIAFKDWVIQEGGPEEADKQAAIDLEAALRSVPGWVAVMAHQANHNGVGWALSEIDWQRRDGLTVPVAMKNAPAKRFMFDRKTDTPILIVDPTTLGAVPLIQGKWWYTRRNDGDLITEGGLLRTAAIWSIFKSMSMKGWLVWADRFGLPYALGKYEDQGSPADKAALEDAVAAIGTDGYAVMSEACEMTLVQAEQGGGASDVHGALVSICDLQISKLVAGATLLNETSGQASYAIGRVHQSRGYDLNMGDAKWLGSSFVESIGIPFVEFNGLDAKPPRLKIYLTLDVGIKEQVEIASTCANELGLLIDEEQIRDITLFRRPQGEPLVGTKNVAADSEEEGEDGEETVD